MWFRNPRSAPDPFPKRRNFVSDFIRRVDLKELLAVNILGRHDDFVIFWSPKGPSCLFSNWAMTKKHPRIKAQVNPQVIDVICCAQKSPGFGEIYSILCETNSKRPS